MRFKIQTAEFFGLRTSLGSCYLLHKNTRGELYFKRDLQYWWKGMGRKEKNLENSNTTTDYRKGRERTFLL